MTKTFRAVLLSVSEGTLKTTTADNTKEPKLKKAVVKIRLYIDFDCLFLLLFFTQKKVREQSNQQILHFVQHDKSQISRYFTPFSMTKVKSADTSLRSA
jgi:hypothetical protein